MNWRWNSMKLKFSNKTVIFARKWALRLRLRTKGVSATLAIALLGNHGLAKQNPSRTANQGPKLERPKINVGVTAEEWNVFTWCWEVFRTGSSISDTSALSQLFQCAGGEYGYSLLKTNPNAATESLPRLLATMRSPAVIPAATCVIRTELLQLQQKRD